MPIGIKLNREDIIKVFLNEGYTILSNDFSKSKDNILVRCSNGHINYKTHDSIIQGRGCPDCKGNKKYTYQFVYEYFKLHDCLLLSKEYNSCKDDLEYLCSCGNKSKITFDNFKNANERCYVCRGLKISLAKRISYEEVYNRISADGNKLLTTKSDYIDANNEIIIECKCGNKFITTFTRYKMRIYQTCVECAHLLSIETKKRSEEDIRDILKSNNLKLIEYNYINNEHIVTLECFCGNTETVNFNGFLNRIHKMCVQCSNEIRFEKGRQYSIEEIRPIFIKRDWVLLSDKFISVDHNLECICDKGHITSTTLWRFSIGNGCRECFIERNRLENHWHWKGGITDLKAYLREQLKEWKIKSLEQNNYKCILSNTNVNLHIHHLYKSFSEIVYKVLEILNLTTRSNIGDYSLEELNDITSMFLKLHDEYGLGVPIESNLHHLFHSLYGKTNNTKEQFEEFVKRYDIGEFNKVLYTD